MPTHLSGLEVGSDLAHSLASVLDVAECECPTSNGVLPFRRRESDIRTMSWEMRFVAKVLSTIPCPHVTAADDACGDVLSDDEDAAFAELAELVRAADPAEYDDPPADEPTTTVSRKARLRLYKTRHELNLAIHAPGDVHEDPSAGVRAASAVGHSGRESGGACREGQPRGSQAAG